MTYCVALLLKEGLVMLSDTRTNAGVDHIATFSKMHVVEVPGERVLCLLAAGNLAVTQAVVHLVTKGPSGKGASGKAAAKAKTLYEVPTMFQAAELVGTAVGEVFRAHGETMRAQNVNFEVSVLLGGQIKGREPSLFEVYAAGNFIEATEDTPFLQIGEHKYGKPILDRAARYDIGIADAVKLVLVSMDSTLRSNVTVGLPIDLFLYRRDAFKTDLRRRITEDDRYFRQLREHWSAALRDAYRALPRPDWMG
jgi:putative proteasome-type protease